jgi:hypothetical protein
MQQKYHAIAIGVILAVGLFLAGRMVGVAQQPAPAADALLVIGEFDIPYGIAMTAAIDEASLTVRAMRKTGEYNNVRLYTHSWGPTLALYIASEPRNWQAVKAGTDKLFAARPELRTAPFKWAGHSDNILTEVTVR